MKEYIPLFFIILVVALFERLAPVVLGVSAIMAAMKFYPLKTVYFLALMVGLIMDATWGKPLGLSALGLIVAVWLVRLLLLHIDQWWLLPLCAMVTGFLLMRLNLTVIYWGLLVLLPVCILGWWVILGRGTVGGRGIYLKDG